MKKISSYLRYKIPFLPVVIFCIIVAIGLWNLEGEKKLNLRAYVQYHDFFKKDITILSNGSYISGEFIAIEPDFGIISFRFQKPNHDTTSSLIFRLKEKGGSDWHYVHEYTANQLYDSDWYPFGFPLIEQSRGKEYEFVIQGMAERNKDAILLLADRGFLVNYQIPNKRLFTPFNRIFLLFQNNVSQRIKGELLLYVGFVIALFVFTFFVRKIPNVIKAVFLFEMLLYIMFLHPDLYQDLQVSTFSFVLLILYCCIFQGLLNGTKILIFSGCLFIIMSIYFICGKVAIAERLSEWIYNITLLGMLLIVVEINMKLSVYKRNLIKINIKKRTLSWDQYFQNYLRPIATSWTKRDVLKYANWYWSWLKYVQRTYRIQFVGKKIVEIGSGAGGVCYLLKNQGADVTGSDVSIMMIKNANQLMSNIPFIYCDIQKSIPTKIKYDCVIGFEVLEHLRYPSDGVSNIYKALKPGGKFIGSSPYPFAKNLLDPTHVNVKYPDEWKKLFVDSGFKNIICQPLSFPPLLWRLHRSLNIPLPFYISIPGFVSTTLLVAER